MLWKIEVFKMICPVWSSSFIEALKTLIAFKTTAE